MCIRDRLVVAWYLLFKKPAKKLEYIGWLFALGGGIGNLVDRVMNGEVVDYINLLFMNFAVFNFADILVCTGIGLLLLGLVLDEVSARRKKQEDCLLYTSVRLFDEVIVEGTDLYDGKIL